MFRSGRELAAFLGLVPRQTSSGGKEKTRTDIEDGRPLPAHAARRRCNGGATPCARGRFRRRRSGRRRFSTASRSRSWAVALANKSARIAWAAPHARRNLRWRARPCRLTTRQRSAVRGSGIGRCCRRDATVKQGDWENPISCRRHLKARYGDGPKSSGQHQGQRQRPHQQAGTHDRTRPTQLRQKQLAKGAPSHT